jgi:hypothetical protein
VLIAPNALRPGGGVYPLAFESTPWKRVSYIDFNVPTFVYSLVQSQDLKLDNRKMTTEAKTRILSHKELEEYHEHYETLLSEVNFRRSDYRNKVNNLLTRGTLLIAGAGLLAPLLTGSQNLELEFLNVASTGSLLFAMTFGFIAIRGSYVSMPTVDVLETAFLQKGRTSALHSLVKEVAPILAENEKVLARNIRLLNIGFALVLVGLILHTISGYLHVG